MTTGETKTLWTGRTHISLQGLLRLSRSLVSKARPIIWLDPQGDGLLKMELAGQPVTFQGSAGPSALSVLCLEFRGNALQLLCGETNLLFACIMGSSYSNSAQVSVTHTHTHTSVSTANLTDVILKRLSAAGALSSPHYICAHQRVKRARN